MGIISSVSDDEYYATAKRRRTEPVTPFCEDTNVALSDKMSKTLLEWSKDQDSSHKLAIDAEISIYFKVDDVVINGGIQRLISFTKRMQTMLDRKINRDWVIVVGNAQFDCHKCFLSGKHDKPFE